MKGRSEKRWLGFYTASGIRTVFKEYGLDDDLRRFGIDDYEIELDVDDPYHQNLRFYQVGRRDEAGLLIELRVHPTCARSRDLVGAILRDQTMSIFFIEWLCLQNSQNKFTEQRPRLPGQAYPGLGIGAQMCGLLIQMCKRLKRQGLLTAPYTLTNAMLFNRAGFHFCDPEKRQDLIDLSRQFPDLHLAVIAWAIERGCMFKNGAPYAYEPGEMLLSLDEAVNRALAPHGFWRRLLHDETHGEFFIDYASLKQSLADNPVEGLTPDKIDHLLMEMVRR
jgi:hypothetical protein